MPEWSFLVAAGIILILLGFLLAASGIMFSVRQSTRQDEKGIPCEEAGEDRVKGAGVIFIGPIPVIFGSDKRFALVAMILAIVLMMLAVLFLK